jgi:hypothetical protein
MMEAACCTFQAWQSYLAGPDHEYLEAYLLLITMELKWGRQAQSDNGVRLAEELVARTANADSLNLVRLRLCALRYLYPVYYEEIGTQIWNRVDDLVVRWPDVQHTTPYINYLRNAAHHAWSIPDFPSLRLVEQRTCVLLQQELPASFRKDIEELILPVFLRVFETEEELRERLQLARSLPASAFTREPINMLRKAELLESVGMIDEVLQMPAALRQRYLDLGLVRSGFQFSTTRLSAEIAAGLSLQEARLHAGWICSATGSGSDVYPQSRRDMAIYLSLAGTLRGDIGWVREILDEYTPGQQCYWPEVEILMALESGRLSTSIRGSSQRPQPASQTTPSDRASVITSCRCIASLRTSH